VVVGAGIPAVWLWHTSGRQDVGDLPLELSALMVGAWVAFGLAVGRWWAVAAAPALGLGMLAVAQVVEGPGAGDTGPTGPLLHMVLLPAVAACVAAGVLVERVLRGRRRA